MDSTAALNWILDLFFPPKCPFCHKLLKNSRESFCLTCQKELPWIQPGSHPRSLEFTSGCISPLHYRDHVRKSVHRYKFHHCPGYSKAYGLLMAQAVRDTWPYVSFDLVTWVPLFQSRKHRRGYDQAMLLAEAVGSHLDLPSVPLLRKVKNTPMQSRITDHRTRQANVLNAYTVLPHSGLEGSTVLLCDDVVTTGSTLSECARILRTAGAKNIYVVTLANAGHFSG